MRNCQPNYAYEIAETGSETPSNPMAQAGAARPAWFQDVSDQLNHSHHEELFDDFARQPLLPNRLSQLGPGVAWFDVDGDGREDLIVGSGKGGSLAVYHNDPQKGFLLLQTSGLTNVTERDQTTIVGWTSSPGVASLLVGLANYEDGHTNRTNGESVARYDFQNGSVAPAGGLPAGLASVGPLALADLAGDGKMALFVGGRVIAGPRRKRGRS